MNFISHKSFFAFGKISFTSTFCLAHRDEALAISQLKAIVRVRALVPFSWELLGRQRWNDGDGGLCVCASGKFTIHVKPRIQSCVKPSPWILEKLFAKARERRRSERTSIVDWRTRVVLVFLDLNDSRLFNQPVLSFRKWCTHSTLHFVNSCE